MKIRDVYLNGQLLREGDDNDYILGGSVIYFNFNIKAQDKLTMIARGWFRSKRTDCVHRFKGVVPKFTPIAIDGYVLTAAVHEQAISLVG
jgi:hypothetical protein